MKNGHCPRCKSTEVFHQAGHHLQAEKVTLKQGVVSKAAAPDRYVCAACGCVELYLADPDHLQLVRETWERVTAR